MSEPTEPRFDGEVMKVPQGTGTTTTVIAPKSPTFGLIIALLFLTLVLILGGLLLWYREVAMKTVLIIPSDMPPPAADQTTATEDTSSKAAPLPPLATSTALDAIETDLENTDLNSIAPDVMSIDTEFAIISESATDNQTNN